MFKPYRYRKREYRHVSSGFRRSGVGLSDSLFALKTAISLVLIVSGLIILVTKVLVPVVVIYADTETNMPVISPVPDGNAFTLSKKDDEEVFTFKELSRGFIRDVDYEEREGLFYPKFLKKRGGSGNLPRFFYLTIPKLDIKDAKVDVNSTNLDPREALGHYNGSCLPDEGCNAFIFGHSSYIGSKNRYREGDYTTIFSRLGELEYGDEFEIKYRDKIYRYVVELTKVQRPENVDPLGEPLPKSLGKYESTVELFTCTPPGTTKYRLSVVGKLVT